MVVVAVSLGCHSKIPWVGSLKQQTLISCSLKPGRSEINTPADSVLPGLQLATFLLSLHVAEKGSYGLIFFFQDHKSHFGGFGHPHELI